MTAAVRSVRSEQQSLLATFFLALTLHTGFILFAMLFTSMKRAPLIQPDDMVEVSLVALPKPKRDMPDKAMEPVVESKPIPKPTPKSKPRAKPKVIVKQSDLSFKDAELANKTDSREELLRHAQMQAALQSATESQPATDAESESDESFELLGAGMRADPELARYVALIQALFMPHFKPLPSIVAANPGIACTVHVDVELDNGTIKKTVIRQSSGNVSYDAAAERAIQAVTSIPLPPKKFEKAFSRGYDIRFVPP